MKIIHACLSDSPLIYELLHHLHQCRKSAQNFFGRELELRKLRTYVTSDSHKIPFFVFGRGGSGKTALLSKACHLIHSEWYKRGLSTFAFPKPLYLFRCEASAGCPILRVHSDVQLCAGPGHVPVSANLLQSQHQVGQRTKNKGRVMSTFTASQLNSKSNRFHVDLKINMISVRERESGKWTLLFHSIIAFIYYNLNISADSVPSTLAPAMIFLQVRHNV